MKTVDLSKFKTAAGAAKALHRAIVSVAGENNAGVNLLTPERSKALGYGKVWRVMWEGGPEEWGIKASYGDFGSIPAKWTPRSTEWYMEPYYSFDVGFVG